MKPLMQWLAAPLLLLGMAFAQAEEAVLAPIYESMNAISELGEKERKQHEFLLEELMAYAEQLPKLTEDKVLTLVWQAVVYEQYANYHGGFKGVRLAKAAKEKLEAAIEADASGLNGLAYTTLGLLYERTPGWPVAFGSLKNAEAMYAKGLEVHPQGVDTNFAFARFLKGIERKEEAFQYAKQALEAQPRPYLKAYDEALQKEALNLVGAKEGK